MLIENKGIKTDNFHIPPFTLKKGEIVVLYLFNGQHFFEIDMFLNDVFIGKMEDENVVVHKSLTFVEHFNESKFRRLFCPVTVGEYLKRNAYFDSPFASNSYETDWINEKTKVNTLAGKPR